MEAEGFTATSQNGNLSGGPYNEDYSILGSTLGSHYFGKLLGALCLRGRTFHRLAASRAVGVPIGVILGLYWVPNNGESNGKEHGK